MPSKNNGSLSRFDPQAIPLLALPSVAFDNRKALPKCAAIYFVLNAEGMVLYIGRSMNLAQRWATHHRTAKLLDKQATRIAWLVMADVALLDAVETACIAYFDPLCNGAPGPGESAKPRGPKPKHRVNVHIYVDPEDYEWFKDQPEGFAGLIRRLMKDYRQRAEPLG